MPITKSPYFKAMEGNNVLEQLQQNTKRCSANSPEANVIAVPSNVLVLERVCQGFLQF